MKIFLINLFFLISFLSKSHALSPEPRIPDEAKEQRAMKLFLEVRCLVCEGQVIENSDTAFSFEMRKLIRRKILEGKSDEEIRQDLVQNFGEEILTNRGNSDFLLWILPITFSFFLAYFITSKKAR